MLVLAEVRRRSYGVSPDSVFFSNSARFYLVNMPTGPHVGAPVENRIADRRKTGPRVREVTARNHGACLRLEESNILSLATLIERARVPNNSSVARKLFCENMLAFMNTFPLINRLVPIARTHVMSVLGLQVSLWAITFAQFSNDA